MDDVGVGVMVVREAVVKLFRRVRERPAAAADTDDGKIPQLRVVSVRPLLASPYRLPNWATSQETYIIIRNESDYYSQSHRWNL